MSGGGIRHREEEIRSEELNCMTLYGFWAVTSCQLFSWSCQNVKTCSSNLKQKSVCTVSPPAAVRGYWTGSLLFTVSDSHLITTPHFLVGDFFSLNGSVLYCSGFTRPTVSWGVKSAARQLTGITTGPLSLMRLETTGLGEKWAAPSAVCYLPTDSSTHLGLSMGLSCPRGTWVNEG